MSTLRGAGVQVDAVRIRYVAAVVGLAVVVVVAGVLLVAGIRKNNQIDTLEKSGVPVELTVSSCRGLTGGTGSNPAGFDCSGTYTYQGRRYFAGVPGSTQLPVGSTVHGVVASTDPALFSTRQTVADEHVSLARIVPAAIVLALALGGLVWVVVRHRRKTVTT